MEVVNVEDIKSLKGKDSIKNEMLRLIKTGHLKTTKLKSGKWSKTGVELK